MAGVHSRLGQGHSRAKDRSNPCPSVKGQQGGGDTPTPAAAAHGRAPWAGRGRPVPHASRAPAPRRAMHEPRGPRRAEGSSHCSYRVSRLPSETARDKGTNTGVTRARAVPAVCVREPNPRRRRAPAPDSRHPRAGRQRSPPRPTAPGSQEQAPQNPAHSRAPGWSRAPGRLRPDACPSLMRKGVLGAPGRSQAPREPPKETNWLTPPRAQKFGAPVLTPQLLHQLSWMAPRGPAPAWLDRG